jgi:hypothetical protein
MRHTHGDRRHFTEEEALHGCPDCAAPTGIINAFEPDPLTDEELDTIEYLAGNQGGSVAENRASDIRRLVAEVRRLRSDDWLQRAAKAIVGEFPDIGPSYGGKDEDYALAEADVAEILRKHRDGKA